MLPDVGARMLAAGLLLHAVPALAETSSWQQRISPQAPAQSTQSQARPKVKSRHVAPDSVPKGQLGAKARRSGAVKGPSLGAATSNSGQAASAAPSNDPAYDAFDQGKYLTALSIASGLAAKGDPQAHTLVARIHAEGLGVAQNYQTAAQWYARASELGDAEGALGLGLLYARGQGVEKNFIKAGELFDKAARKGHAEACYNLALLFLSGQGKPENPRRALALMTYAAEHGVVPAMYDLGSLYATGTGTDPNAFEAARWIGRAAAAGYAEAEVEFAVLLFRGHGVPPDPKRAVSLLRAAADKGIATAQNRLARAYQTGLGVAANNAEAMKWHLIARAGGVADPMLDKVLAGLPVTDQRRAEAVATEWRERALLE